MKNVKQQSFDIAKQEACSDFLFEIKSNSKNIETYYFGNSAITSINFVKTKEAKQPEFSKTEYKSYQYYGYSRRYGRCKRPFSYTQYKHELTIHYTQSFSCVKFFMPKNIVITKRLNLIEKSLKREIAKNEIKNKSHAAPIFINDKTKNKKYSYEREKNLSIIAKFYGQEFANAAAKWDQIVKSPYSNSFYDSDQIDWNYKPELSFRLSDHWNFYSQGQRHCKIANIEGQFNKPMLAVYVSGGYQEVSI